MNKRMISALLVVAMCTVSIAPVAVAQETPFVISGGVFYANGEPVSNPTVTITNQNTDESFTAGMYENYYRVVTTSAHVHAGDRITINATDGTYAVGAIHSITETDIENGGFGQNLPSMPDLVITSANVTCLENKTFNITYTVANIGNENGGASQTTIYIDGSPVLDKDDPVAPLAPGEVYTNTVGPFNFPQRSPWIMVCADNDNAVDELNEDNNCMETRLECPLPNLQVKKPGGRSARVLNWVDSAKGTYYIHYMVSNQQSTVFGGQCNTSINITTVASDGSILDSEIFKQPVRVECGGISKKTSTLTCLCNHSVTVDICADADTEILESDESDNCYEISFVCPASEPLPDLEIINHSVAWVNRTDRTFNVTYTVKNVGNGNASTSKTNFSVVSYDDSVPALSPGENYTNTAGPFDATFDVSNHYYVTIAICADCYDAVTESDETNNCATDGIGGPYLNISIESVDWVDELNKAYNISYEVLNSGGAASTNVTRAYVYIDGNTNASATEKVGIMPKPPIDNPTSVTGLFGPFTMTGTSDTLNVCVEWEDGKNCVEEVFGSDNQMPDLVIENQSVVWVDRLNRTFNVTYTVKNIGNGNANSSTTNISVVNYDDPVPALSPDESYTNTVGPFDATFDESNHYYVAIIICANYYKTVTESDDANNCATDGIGIPYLNISIESVDWVELNKTYNISYEVLNSGGAVSSNGTRAYVYIDGNTNASATEKVGIMPKPPIDNPTSVTGLFGPFTMTGTSDTISVCVEWEDGKNCVEEVFGYQATSGFDTGTGTYPGISGTHNGTLIPDEDIEVNRLYTYACTGTGGHTKYVRIWNGTENVDGQGNWSGYPGDYHNVTISPAITLLQGHTYNYTIETGSYPQIVHAKSKSVTGGTITCTKFTDANGKRYTNCIPAIRLFYEEQ